MSNRGAQRATSLSRQAGTSAPRMGDLIAEVKVPCERETGAPRSPSRTSLTWCS